MDDKIKGLYDKDNKKAYKLLKELEIVSSSSDELYKYFDNFLAMLDDERLFLRVRGFRMISSLAMWDKDLRIDQNIDLILSVFDSKNGIEIRQCLEALRIILLYKIELNEIIRNKLINIDLSKYKESMQSLIKKDIDNILRSI